MNAVTISEFGSVDELKYSSNIKIPVPEKNQVLIKVHATSINPLDINIRKGVLKLVLGSSFPMILGNDVSGVIVQCGDGVKRFNVGDEVYCMSDSNTKFASNGFAKSGAYAEYVVTREDTLSLKPMNLTHNEAAAIPLCALTAYQTLIYLANTQKGKSILINGASGGVGIYATQIAISLGVKVTAICNAKNAQMMHDLGVNDVIDYKTIKIENLNAKFDIIYDVVANQKYSKMKKLLTKNGIYISNVAPPIVFLLPALRKKQLFKQYGYSWVYPVGKDLEIISKMIDSGEIKPYIDKVFPLSKTKQAHQYFENNRKIGKVIIEISL